MAEPSDECDDIFDSPAGDSPGKGAPKFGIKGPDGRPCEKCPKDIPLSFCPHWPCNICYNHHYHQVCPYFDFYPQGAPLSPCYDIICSMGHPFNEEKWVCTSCPGNEARISRKYCRICRSRMHGTYECPEDKVAAAKYKLFRDEMCSEVFKLNPPKSSYVPTPSPGFVNMKEVSSETLKQSHCGVAAAAEHSKDNQSQISSSSETMPISEIACSYSALILHDDDIPIASEKITYGRGIYVKELLELGVEKGSAEIHPKKYSVVAANKSFRGDIQVGVTFTKKAEQEYGGQEFGGWKHSESYS